MSYDPTMDFNSAEPQSATLALIPHGVRCRAGEGRLMTVSPFRGAHLDAAPALAPPWPAVRGVPAAGTRLRLVRPDALEGVADVALVLLQPLSAALVASRREVARHG